MKKLDIKYLAVCLIILLSLLLGTSCVYIDTPSQLPPSPHPADTTTPINPAWTPPTEASATPLPDIASVVALVKPSVVAINTEVVTFDIFNRPSTQQGAGSGWIIDEKGLIVTNNHVVEGAKSVTVVLDDERTFPAEKISSDRLTDLAVIKIKADNLPATKVGDSSQLRVGEWLVAIGNPLGQGLSAKEGIVSRLGVSIQIAAGQTLSDLVETSAAINPGNSGGPLVNMAGEVIGITSVKIATIGVEGMGYAISSKSAMPIIQELIQQGYVVRPWLGVVLRDVDPFVVFRFDLTVESGVLVTEVAPNSPALLAGLEVDDVIVGFAGKEITGAQDLIQAIHSSQIGQSLEITYWRGDTKYTAYATLTESPPP